MSLSTALLSSTKFFDVLLQHSELGVKLGAMVDKLVIIMELGLKLLPGKVVVSPELGPDAESDFLSFVE